MKKEGCPSCEHLGRNCGGHWSSKTAVHTYTGNRRPRTTLDTQEANPDSDSNAYQVEHD